MSPHVPYVVGVEAEPQMPRASRTPIWASPVAGAGHVPTPGEITVVLHEVSSGYMISKIVGPGLAKVL